MIVSSNTYKTGWLLSIFILTMLSFFSCSEAEKVDGISPNDMPPTELRLSLATKASESGFVVPVNALRIVVFDSMGKCLANQKMSETDYDSRIDGEANIVTVNTLVNIPGESRTLFVYAVVNEDGVFTSMGDTDASLSDILNSITIGSYDIDVFTSILNTSFLWNSSDAEVSETAAPLLTILKADNVIVEKANIGHQLDVEITDAESTLPTMAIVQIGKITSESIDGIAYDGLSEAARVFVLDAYLDCVKTEYNPYQTRSKKDNGAITLVGKNASGYITRRWNGKISQKTTGKLKHVDRVETRYYRYLVGSQGDGCWSVVSHGQAAIYSKIDAGDRYNGNNGNIRNFINEVLTPLFSNPDTYSSDPLDKDGLVDGNAVPSSTPWVIDVNRRFYVPENLAEDSNAATCIVVKLAVATPVLDHSGISDDDWESFASWDSPQFKSDGYPIADYTDDSRNFFKQFSHACWSDDPSVIDVKESGKSYNFFVGDFTRVRTGLVDKSFKTGDSKIRTSWEDISTSDRIMEVRVPINNHRFDSDYSVRKGVQYKVDLFVDKTTYDKVANSTQSRSCQQGGQVIKSSVKAETICR